MHTLYPIGMFRVHMLNISTALSLLSTRDGKNVENISKMAFFAFIKFNLLDKNE